MLTVTFITNEDWLNKHKNKKLFTIRKKGKSWCVYCKNNQSLVLNFNSQPQAMIYCNIYLQRLRREAEASRGGKYEL